MEKMTKSIVEGIHPETGEKVFHSVEANAICTVSVKKGDNKKEGVEVTTSVMGAMNAELTHAMIEALIGACSAILKDVDPMVAAMILCEEMLKLEEKMMEGDKDVAGESSEPERPAKQ